MLRQKQPILYSTERLYEIFKEAPVVAYRRSPNLRDLLVRAKLKNPSTVTQPNHSFDTFRTGIAEVMGSNPVEVLIFFRLLLSNCLNWKIYGDDHSSLSSTTAVQI